MTARRPEPVRRSERVADLAAPIVQSRIGGWIHVAGAIDAENVVAVGQMVEGEHRGPMLRDGVAERAADMKERRAAEPRMAHRGIVLVAVVDGTIDEDLKEGPVRQREAP